MNLKKVIQNIVRQSASVTDVAQKNYEAGHSEASTPSIAATQPIDRLADFDQYENSFPCSQNAVNALPGWNMALPPEANTKSGLPVFYLDPRITWACEQVGSLEGKHVLELGPLEASHTYMIDARGPASITAIEANRLSFLRCLVVKELVGLKSAKFLLGDFVAWLEQTNIKYDFVVASGVLYHMENPIKLIELLAKRSDRIYLWTHYADINAMPPDDPRNALLGQTEVVESSGVKVRLYPRSYWGAGKNDTFCGGPNDMHRWIERNDLLDLLKALGMKVISIAHDDPKHVNGPSFSIYAQR
jgi:Protein of unknown function (DUF1698)